MAKATAKKVTTEAEVSDELKNLADTSGADWHNEKMPANWKKLERHPLSERFALPATDEENAAMSLDIAENGQHQEILMYEGKVLDGWRRYEACIQQGKMPKLKNYTGTDPASVAFSCNAMRRRMTGVQKALLAARYYIELENAGRKIGQQKIAKMSALNLNNLNGMVKLLKLETAEAKRAIEQVTTDPEMTSGELKNILVDLGIVAVEKPTRKKAGDADDSLEEDVLGPQHTRGAEPDEHEDEAFGGDADDIDEMLDAAEDEAIKQPTRKASKAGDNVIDLEFPSARSNTDRRAKETPVSKAKEYFKSLTEPERVEFVKFAWSMLRPAVETAVKEGRVPWANLQELVGEFKFDAGTAALADMSTTLAPEKPAAKKTKGKAKPAVDEFDPDDETDDVEFDPLDDGTNDAEPPAKKTAAAKKTAPAKKAVAKKVAAKPAAKSKR